jgi:hypothetical protein
MMTNETMTAQPGIEPAGVPVPGWQRPAWAEEFYLDGSTVTFRRDARRVPLVYQDVAWARRPR